MNDTITVYRSQSPEYERAFQTFLDHTNQKDAARAWLAPRVARLPDKRLLVDAGAGEGKLTAWFCGEFARTIAIEPSEYLRAKLLKNCPGAEIVGGSILQAAVDDRAADLVLCSHVLYYIPVERWMEHAEKLAGWIADDGVLVVLLQNRHSDCSRMVAHFGGAPSDLRPFAEQFEQQHGRTYTAQLNQLPSFIETQDFASAYAIGEFILNSVQADTPIQRTDLEAYIRQHFAADGRYRFSCDQDCLAIGRAAR